MASGVLSPCSARSFAAWSATFRVIEFKDEIIFLLTIGLQQDLKQRKCGGRCLRTACLDSSEEFFTDGEIAGMSLDKIDERNRIKVDRAVPFQKSGQRVRLYHAPRSFLRWVFGYTP
jgi:hypothetical protein